MHKPKNIGLLDNAMEGIMENDIILDVKGITKSFPGVVALSNVSFQVRRGDIHAIVGENGAGKSTLIKILSGIYSADKGSFYFNNKAVNIRTPLQAQMLGISVVHQEMRLVEELTVVENIYLGRPKVTKLLKLIDWVKMYEEGEELLKSMNAELNLKTLVNKLSVAEKQLVEICKALSFNSKLIIMDEPSATLTERELNRLFGILEMLKANGVTVIYISHRLEEIFKIADKVTVLRDGNHINTINVCDTNRNQIISMMVGRELGHEFPKEQCNIGDVVLEIRNLYRGNILKNINLTARRGEILGISGLVGSKRTELARVIYGADKKTSGEIIFNHKSLNRISVSKAIYNKIGLVPEDRKNQGLNLAMTIRENISMVGIDRILSYGIINKKKDKNLANKFIKLLRIITPSEERAVINLSGGNQQKVVLAKWLAVESDLLIFDEPTRGIDVGAKSEIYKLMCDLAKQGKTILMISSEMPELIAMCDRMYIMHDGRITGELKRSEFSQEKIMGLSTI
jgi:ABC-type sugar transport system ATPase subunit